MSGVVEQLVSEGYKKTEVGVVPSDWEVLPLSNLTVLMTNGFVGTAKTHYTDSHEGVLYIQGYNVEENSFNFRGIKKVTPEFHKRQSKSCLREGDVLMVQTGDVGLTTIVPNELVGANCHALIISRFKLQNLDPQYFSYYLNSKDGRNRLKDLEVGTTMKHINVGDLLHFLVPVPSSKIEQTAIANALSDVDTLITSLEKFITKKRAIKTSVMQQLLTGKKRLPPFDKTHTGYKQTELGEIPKDWGVEQLGKLGSFKNGVNKDGDSFGYGKPFVNLMDVFGKISIKGCEKFGLIDSTELDRREYDVKKGDVLFIRSSVKPSGVGLTAVVLEDLVDTIYSGFLIRYRSKESLDTNYKKYCFHESGFRKRIVAASSVSANTNINQDSLKQLALAYPSIPEEQIAIADVLSDMDKEIEVLEQRLNKTEQLKQGMMQELLTGRTRLL